jgi:hypothetical protein
MEGYLGVGSEKGAGPGDGYNQLINNINREMLFRVEAKLMATNTIEVNLQVMEDQVYKSHPLVSRRRRLFKYRNKGGNEKNTDFIKSIMLQSRKAELPGLTGEEMVIYLTLHQVTNAELVKKWYK